MNVGRVNGLQKLFLGKILCVCSGPEHGTAYVDGVCACPKCRLKALVGACRRQQLYISFQSISSNSRVWL